MDITEKASNLVHEAGEKIAVAAHQARESVEEAGKQCRNAEQRLLKNCCDHVRDYPITSVGIAAVAGFMLSRLFSGCQSTQ